MCAIVGVLGAIDDRVIHAMGDAVAHRGPDGSGTFVDRDAGVALGHRRLAIIDLSDAARQPMANEDGSIQIVVNGEIYNHVALRTELERAGHRFRSRSDSEVIVHLYEEYGDDLLPRLEGMFAFALWDGRRRRLLVARDRFGVKPLYWTELPGGGFAFASELKALLEIPGVPRTIDHEALHLHLSLIWCPAPHTMLAGVNKLLPGHLVVVDNGQTSVRQWYRSTFDGTELDLSDRELAQETRRLLDQAVERQMISDVPVGAFLSGGIDSTSIVALMRAHATGPVPCYTVALSGRPDEHPMDLPYARQAAAQFGVELREIPIDVDPIADTEMIVASLDEPIADPAAINVQRISAAARADGVPVLLSGAGGDDLFGGYARHVALAFDDLTSHIPGPVARGARRVLERGSVHRPVIRRARKYLASSHLSADDRLAGFFLWHTSDVVRPLYTPEVRRALDGFTAIGPLVAGLGEIPAEHRRLNRMLFLEQRHFLADHNLIYTDKMSMRHGVEVRVPFLDTDLVEFAATLPRRSKQHRRRLKGVLRDAMAADLPPAILTRPKTGFGAPLRRWIREDLCPMVDEVLSPSSLTNRGLFDPEAVRSLVDRNHRGEIDAAYLVYTLVCAELWMRRFVDAPGGTP